MKSPFINEKLNNLDRHYVHSSYLLEKKLLSAIQQGLMNEALDLMQQINNIEKPVLARDTSRSIRNALIASCTLFTRAAINAGIDTEDAFDLSDVFIKHIELIDNRKELIQFEYEMVKQFVTLINQNRTKQYKYPVSRIVTYIYENSTSKITTKDLAREVHLSPDYLSRIFYDETGMHITDYIQRQKIEVAKNFLVFSDMNVTDIATLLSYCNASYFTNVFKKYEGLSPKQYRHDNK